MVGEPHKDMQPETEGEITLSFEPPDDPNPKLRAKESQLTPPPPVVDEVEYDDFGLPVRKLPRTPVYDDASSDDEQPPDTITEKPKEPTMMEKKGCPIATAEPSPLAQLPSTADPSPPAQLPASAVPIPPAEKVTETKTENSHDTALKNNRESLLSLPEKDRWNNEVKMFSEDPKDPHMATGKNTVSEWSHQQIIPRANQEDEVSKRKVDEEEEEDEWQTMPAYASYDMYDDDGCLIAKALDESGDEEDAGAAKGYTRVYGDEDAESVTSMDENTKYLFKDNEDDEASRNPLSQMQATKELLTEGQRIAYVGVCRLALIEMLEDMQKLKAKGRSAKKNLQVAIEGMRMWSQKMMVRLYTHMELSPPGMYFSSIAPMV